MEKQLYTIGLTNPSSNCRPSPFPRTERRSGAEPARGVPGKARRHWPARRCPSPTRIRMGRTRGDAGSPRFCTRATPGRSRPQLEIKDLLAGRAPAFRQWSPGASLRNRFAVCADYGTHNTPTRWTQKSLTGTIRHLTQAPKRAVPNHTPKGPHHEHRHAGIHHHVP